MRRWDSAGRLLAAILFAALALALAACGGDDDGGSSESEVSVQDDVIAQSLSPEKADFPAVQGRTLQEIANLAEPGTTFTPATSHYVPGENRIAFGLLNSEQQLIYGATAVYVARSPEDKASGPFLAPTDSLVTEEAFRSKTAALESDAIAAIYGTEVELPKPGRYAILALTYSGEQLVGAPSELTVAKEDPIPAVGEEPPGVETDTLAAAGGNIEEIDTREPPSSMHEASLDEVIGEKPVALLFATPALCQSRVCGPVVDVAEQLKAKGYGDEVEFIHQEVYVDNDLSKGLREPLLAFNLETEPWLFTFDEDGRVAARLEGSFGLKTVEAALKAAGAQG